MPHATPLSETVANTAAKAVDTLTEAATDQVGTVKSALADDARILADSLRGGAQGASSPLVAALAAEAAGHLESAAQSLRGSDLNTLTADAARIMRNNPYLVAGGVLISSFALIRLLRAADESLTAGKEA